MRIPTLLLPLLLALAGCDEPLAAKLQGYDVLARPGGTVTLRAKLEKRGALGVNPDVRGEPVLFRLGESAIGEAATGDDGTASLAWKPPAGAAVHEISLSLRPGSRYRASALPLRVYLRDAERPSLVVDIDGTICAGGEKEVATKPASEIAAVEGAAEALVALAESFDLLYLTGRDDALIETTRAWLDLRGFPRAPILFRDLSLFTLSAEAYKKEALLSLRKEFRLVAGIGDRPEDAEAYMAAGLAAYLVGDTTKVPRGARKLVRFEEIVRLLR